MDVKKIEEALCFASAPDAARLEAMLERALKLESLSTEALASLLKIEDAAALDMLCAYALKVKEKVFGTRIVFFAPLYVTNFCTNGCAYCGFNAKNSELGRKALTPKEAVAEATTLEKMGFKRVLLVAGEDRTADVEKLADTVREIYAHTGIRIVHVNAAPMTTEEFRVLKKAGVGVYQSFQETYHPETYAKMHPSGRKKDYAFRLGAMDRAMAAGFEDVGIGALLGLYDARFDALAVIEHSRLLFERHGAHAHTISVPRLRPAEGSALDNEHVKKYAVSDFELRKITAVYRLAVPTAGVVISTREPSALRNELISAGASQFSAASRTDPGGYGGAEKVIEQFSTNDKRPLLEVMEAVIRRGAMPSLCTMCYRSGRVGHAFGETTRAGEMEKFCNANAILTLKEYALEHPLNGLSGLFSGAIDKAVNSIKDETLKKAVLEKIEKLEKGERDIHF
ncbi:MAG: [FeFe] hydrogenase H-cluster radical SAM maturase HydG [Deltaproteobacteria bacterium]|nr:[FeFe] hydrogenase H-cluster radical SAM maturase HydG [Deltaproteobacteria bacterium]